MKTIYHGGTEVVENPKVDAGREGLDFGQGFYTTEIIDQARKWADKTSRQRLEVAVANDRVIDTVEGYINGTIDAEHALKELSKHQPNHQICFLNQKLVDECVRFVKAI